VVPDNLPLFWGEDVMQVKHHLHSLVCLFRFESIDFALCGEYRRLVNIGSRKCVKNLAV
jgi:hypothetical protein